MFFFQYVGEPSDDRFEEDCIVACPIDCVLSEWSQWTPCSQTCGLGMYSIIIVVIITWTTEKPWKKIEPDITVFKVSDWYQRVKFMQNLEHDVMLFNLSESIIDFSLQTCNHKSFMILLS